MESCCCLNGNFLVLKSCAKLTPTRELTGSSNHQWCSSFSRCFVASAWTSALNPETLLLSIGLCPQSSSTSLQNSELHENIHFVFKRDLSNWNFANAKVVCFTHVFLAKCKCLNLQLWLDCKFEFLLCFLCRYDPITTANFALPFSLSFRQRQIWSIQERKFLLQLLQNQSKEVGWILDLVWLERPGSVLDLDLCST